MKPDASISPDARCLSCGYLLRGLPESVCPECARAFDPADPSTFDADPLKRRRRRWLIRIVVGLALVATAGALAPRGILKADVKFTCSRCGESSTVTRWQLNPPSWISFAYPGIESRTVPAASSNSAQCDHVFRANIRSDLPIGGRVTGSTTIARGIRAWVNGERLLVDDASAALRVLLEPGNNGIQIGPERAVE